MYSHKNNDKQLLYSLIFVGLVAGLFGHYFETGKLNFATNSNLNSATALLATEQNLTSTTPSLPLISLGFVGDIMLDRGVKKSVMNNMRGDYSKLFANTEFLKTPDIMFANLEGPVSDQGKDKRNLYSFRMDPKSLIALKDSGIDVVSFANNHVGDYGRPAFEDTLKRLRDTGILSCGAGMNRAEAETPAIVVQNNFKVGYLCFSDVGPADMEATDSTSGILLASNPRFDEIIKNAATKVDALIVSFHFGEEYEQIHNGPQEALAKKAINDGAVMIVGHHPHVPQDIAYYDGKPVLYSLGNFIFDQYFSKETMGGLFVTATLIGTEVSNVTSHQIVLNKNFVPHLAK